MANDSLQKKRDSKRQIGRMESLMSFFLLFCNYYNCMILLATSSTNRLSCSTNISVGFASFMISSICILDITSFHSNFADE